MVRADGGSRHISAAKLNTNILLLLLALSQYKQSREHKDVVCLYASSISGSEVDESVNHIESWPVLQRRCNVSQLG